uniref:Serine/threonine protein phosphatase 2A 57 kDa regulatory subunit B' theta isoform-like n=1 Tax=Dermatophagoides pteronyssinus TaxID=6956 RepID=A0A6P6XRF6_DERPT|nr:serine/threonine protein phosphatase 2A 57 kDa regulatory subunit B' theta isoform-like [Dermatophagoides pteronyssinus]
MDNNFKNICMKIYDFTNDNNLMEKLEKYKKLELICDLFMTEDTVEENINIKYLFPDIMDIIKMNLFRSLGPSKLQNELINYGHVFEKYNSTSDLNDHLNIVYKILNLSIQFFKKDFEYTRTIFDDLFVQQLLELIHSDDETERNHISSIVCLIYQYIPTRRNIIDKIIIQKLNDIISYDSIEKVHIHLENLLYIYRLMLNRDRSNSDLIAKQQQQRPFQMNAIKSLLLSLHRLPYLYYYYIPLFTCTIKFMTKYPNEIIDFIRRLFSWRNLSSSSSLHTTISMLILAELKQVLNLLLLTINNNDDGSNINSNNDSERIFSKIIPLIMPFLIKNLQSLNAELVHTTLNLLCSFEYQNYFDKFMSIDFKYRLLSILNNQQYIIDWNNRVHVQQVLYALYLQKSNQIN